MKIDKDVLKVLNESNKIGDIIEIFKARPGKIYKLKDDVYDCDVVHLSSNSKYYKDWNRGKIQLHIDKISSETIIYVERVGQYSVFFIPLYSDDENIFEAIYEITLKDSRNRYVNVEILNSRDFKNEINKLKDTRLI